MEDIAAISKSDFQSTSINYVEVCNMILQHYNSLVTKTVRV